MASEIISGLDHARWGSLRIAPKLRRVLDRFVEMAMSITGGALVPLSCHNQLNPWNLWSLMEARFFFPTSVTSVTQSVGGWSRRCSGKNRPEDLQVTVRRLEDKIDRLAAEITRGRTADRSQLDLLLEEAADHDQDQVYGQPDDHSDETGVGHE